jgi:hypothetical protein
MLCCLTVKQKEAAQRTLPPVPNAEQHAAACTLLLRSCCCMQASKLNLNHQPFPRQPFAQPTAQLTRSYLISECPPDGRCARERLPPLCHGRLQVRRQVLRGGVTPTQLRGEAGREVGTGVGHSRSTGWYMHKHGCAVCVIRYFVQLSITVHPAMKS